MTISSSQPHPRNVKRAKKSVRITVKEKKPLGIKANGRPKKPKLSLAERKAIAERQQDALDLRISGLTYREIAEALNYANPSSARKAVDRAITRIETDAAKETVVMDLARLEEFIMRCTHALRNNGDLHQIDRIMRVMEFRYRLMGITDETVRELRAEHGVANTTVNKNNVQIVVAAPETESEFIEKMMGVVGVDPNSPQARMLLESHTNNSPMPLLEGSANDSMSAANSAKEIVDAEIVDEPQDDDSLYE